MAYPGYYVGSKLRFFTVIRGALWKAVYVQDAKTVLFSGVYGKILQSFTPPFLGLILPYFYSVLFTLAMCN
jgi:hypothetical protein